MADPWNVLIVDDEEDIHRVTNLTLKRSVWRDRPFNLTSAFTAKEARALLEHYEEHKFHVALVDVVMESDNAGLELCEWIRANLPRTLRIILRTGQAGIAPEERVLNEYDIDFYLSKEEVNQRLLYNVIRSCLRSASDISTLNALGDQLRSLTTCLREVATVDEMIAIMRTSLQFLEHKHGVRMAFVSNVKRQAREVYVSVMLRSLGSPLDQQRALDAINTAHTKQLKLNTSHKGDQVGLSEAQLVYPTMVTGNSARKLTGWDRLVSWFKGRPADEGGDVKGGLIVDFDRDRMPKRAYEELIQDVRLFVENWQLVYSILLAQENIARLRAMDAEAFWQLQQRDTSGPRVSS